MDNKDTAKIMRETRKQRGLTQSDLALVLDKTAAKVSDIERGKIQISASDLYKIANALNKPREYFFGDPFESQEIEDLVFYSQTISRSTKKIVEQTRMLLSLNAFQQLATGKEREMSDQGINEEVNYIIRYADEIEAIYKVTSELKRNIKDAFKSQKE